MHASFHNMFVTWLYYIMIECFYGVILCFEIFLWSKYMLFLFMWWFCIMYLECDIWILHHFNGFFENAISCICQINIIFISFYINSPSFYMLVSNHLVAFSYPVCNMQKRSIFFQRRCHICNVFLFMCAPS